MLETLRNLGPSRLLVIAAIVAASIAFFFFITSRLTTPSMALLYSDLDPTDSGRIVAKLEAQKVPYDLRGNGQIYVPGDQVLRLRMTMAGEGLPSGGSMGYELFDKSEAFGTSSFVLDVQHLRALEGELSRSIRSLNYVQNARVHLVLPKREAFSREPQEASASVLLQMVGGRRLSKTEVAAIQHLVASAVPKLKSSRISIVDNQGTLLANGEAKDEKAAGALAGDDARLAYEMRMSRTIEDMLERTVGPGRVRAEVTADMDFDRMSTTSETYDPDGQVVRSTQSVEENNASRDGETQPVSVAGNLPGQPATGPTNSAASNKSSRTEETVNYEISKKTETYVREGGAVKHLSVAVLVDGTYGSGANGGRTYQPRSADEMQMLTRLVQSAVGYNAERGDKVEVVNLRFAQGDDTVDEVTRPLFGMSKNDYMRIAELVVMGVVAILILLMVVRPLMKRILESLPDAIASSKNLISDTIAAAQQPSLLPPGADPALIGALGAPIGIGGSDAQIDLAQVEGRVRESTVKKVGEIVDKHPEEAVNIIRSWMYQQN
ncbi:MAG TPA: flagellar basal-body MS-ring/collar protein FliF [Alphaproteobacteria bacterium]|nr:flagellar basal-body MS-ring/collar protein FliF [Alphaproteobacteria bacterium]